MSSAIARGTLALAALGSASVVMAADPTAVEFFEKNIRPVLVDNCYECHGGDPAKIKARLDASRIAAVAHPLDAERDFSTTPFERGRLPR